MRKLPFSLALLVALGMFFAMTTTASAQEDRISLNAAVGPSFANMGTTFSTVAGLDVRLTDHASLVGEVGMMPHAPFRDAAEIAPPVSGVNSPRVNAYHWNGNVKVRPFRDSRFEPYVTGGVGSFTADTILSDQMIGVTRFEDRRRATNLASNLGAGVNYRFNDWVGIGADYRTFFVHRDDTTPRVNRFTAGLTFSLK
jgi:opacity protein-like surface antigen